MDRITKLNRAEIGIVAKWALDLGWTSSMEYLQLCYDADPNGFVASRAPNGQIEGVIFGCRLSSDQSSVSFFIVKESLRGRGIGAVLWKALEAHVRGRSMTLVSCPENMPTYLRKGFECDAPLVKCDFVCSDPESLVDNGNSGRYYIQQLTKGKFEALCEYDKSINSISRRSYLEKFTTCDNTNTFLVTHTNGRILGYGCSHQVNQDLCLLGPVFLSDPRAMYCLAGALVMSAPPGATMRMFYLKQSTMAKELLAQVDVVEELDHWLMVKGEPARLRQKDKVLCLTSSDYGVL